MVNGQLNLQNCFQKIWRTEKLHWFEMTESRRCKIIHFFKKMVNGQLNLQNCFQKIWRTEKLH